MRVSLIVLALALCCISCDRKDMELELKEKLVCSGNDGGRLRNVKVHATDAQIAEWGSVLDLTGNCNATLENLDITSPKVAITAGGNAKVVLQGGRIEGGTQAIVASGNATIEIKGTEIVGKVETSGNAKVTGLDSAKKPGDDKGKDKGAEKSGDDKGKKDKKEEGGW